MEDGSAAVDAVSAHVVDEEEENRIRDENRAFRQMLCETPIAEVIELGEANVVTRGTNHIRQHSNNTCGTKRKFCLTLSVFALIVAAAVVASLLLTENASKHVADPSTDLTELLISVSFDEGTSLQMPSTPQNRALNWLLSNPNLAEYSNAKKVQRYALATLYYSTTGEEWFNNTNWLNGDDECGSWWQDLPGGTGNYTLQCSASGDLEYLKLFYNGLNGMIAPEIGLLSSLKYLSFAGNDLHGTIPSEISEMAQLTRLSLDRNDLTGLIPTSITQMTQLDWLDLVENSFHGEFSCPDWIDVCFISCAYFNDTSCRYL